MKRVLSIVGGGIKGVIPALVCQEIEKRKPLHQLFDLVAGTSTGAIIAGAIGMGFTSDRIVDLYRKEGPNIFKRPRSFWGQLHRAKYPGSRLYDVLKDYFGETTLSEVGLNILATAYDVTGRWDAGGNPGPVFFKSWRPELADFLLADAVQASSAAPSYFPPHRVNIPWAPGETACLYDGGLYAGDPTLCAYAEAKRLWPDEEIHVLSLGTGTIEGTTKCSDAEGLINLAQNVHGWMLDGSTDTVPYIADRILPHFIKLDAGMKAYVRMDDASPGALDILAETAADIIAAHGEAIESIVSLPETAISDLERAR